MESRLAEIGEEVYSENKAECEKTYLGKVIAIEVESKSFAGIGESLDEAYGKALRNARALREEGIRPPDQKKNLNPII